MMFFMSNINKSVNQLLLIITVAYFLSKTVKCDEFQYQLSHLKTKSNSSTQAKAVLQIISRLLPNYVGNFTVEIDENLGPEGKDTFSLVKVNSVVKISGTTGVAAAWGFHYYLKHFCHAHISWETTQLNLPQILPEVNISVTTNDRFRYYQNVCTTSYSFVWWSWKEWEEHIEWMALNGINLALAFNGQEAIWKRVYTKFNLSNSDFDEYFAGPAFLSWSRMGNIRGWAGPLSDNWHQRSLDLQKKILEKMRNIGIIPILPAFAGYIPRAFQRLYPDAEITKMDTWNKFQDNYCCQYLLDPTDDLFNKIGTSFMQEQINEFETDHVYNCDTFNEMIPKNGNLQYLQNISQSIYSAMINVDSKAIWILQNWFLVHDMLFWTEDRAKAFFTAVPKGKMIVLDLQSEQHPQYIRFDSYYGQPFIWCMLHNFGGTLGMFGSANIINTEVFNGRNFKNSTMIGTGLTPEGINQNYVIYDLMTEMFWRKNPTNLTKWFHDYSRRRYGQINANAFKAWEKLSKTVYNFHGFERIRGKYVISRSPKLNLKPKFWYNVTDFFYVWEYLITVSDVLGNNSGYNYDIVDVTRQVLQIYADLFYNNLIKSFKEKNLQEFSIWKNFYSELFDDLNQILSTNEAFLLGKWLNSAKAAAANSQEEKLYEFNARNQISLWGPNGEIKDYANKQWAGKLRQNNSFHLIIRAQIGVVANLFAKRWEYFMDAMNQSLISGKPFNETRVIQYIFTEIEKPFTTDTTKFSHIPKGNSVEIAKEIHKKWKEKLRLYIVKKNGRNRFLRLRRNISQVIKV